MVGRNQAIRSRSIRDAEGIGTMDGDHGPSRLHLSTMSPVLCHFSLRFRECDGAIEAKFQLFLALYLSSLPAGDESSCCASSSRLPYPRGERGAEVQDGRG